MRCARWGALTVILAACAGPTDPDQLVEFRLREADAAYEAWLFPEAARLYEFVAQNRPLLKRAHVRLAESYEALGRPVEAIHWYEIVRDEIDQTDLFVLERLARLYEATGFLPEAAESFARIVGLAPGHPTARGDHDRVAARMCAVFPPPGPDADLPIAFPPPPDKVAQADRLVSEAARTVESLAERTSLPLDVPGRTELVEATRRAHQQIEAALPLYFAALQQRFDDGVQRKAQMAQALREYLARKIAELQGGLP